jgi:hypothetical protein
MHPTIGYHLATAQIAAYRRQAQRKALARASRKTRPHRSQHAVPTLPTFGRRVLAVLGSRST